MKKIKIHIRNNHWKKDSLPCDLEGEKNNTITKEAEKISEGFTYILHIIQKSILAIVYGSFAFMINVQASLLALVVGALVVLSFSNLVSLSKRYSLDVLSSNEATNSYTSEFLASLKYLFSTNNSNYIVSNLKIKLQNYSTARYKLDFYGKLSKEIPEPIGVMIIVIILIINNLYTQFTILTVLMSSFLLFRMFRNITSIQFVYQKLMGISASINKVINLDIALDNINDIDGVVAIEGINNVDLNKVSFDFNGYKVLDNINFEFRKGTSYAIVGDSGSGKTTLLNLLTFLYSPQSGNLTINGLDSKSIKKSLYRNKIGYVSQELVYFDGSIKENIELDNSGNKNLNIIIEKLALSSLVSDKGLDNVIINFGKNLSGGQLQKINIARELYKNPELLILDEATSALDSGAERQIMDYILDMSQETIIIIIAHRLSSIMDVDEILFLDKGSIVDVGGMKKLYHSNLQFKKMCNNQSIFLD